ncbi:MAG TPA: cysteine desulfurase family protein [Bacilli bacterium]|nr:cysteine desulfurase family protein [Bacilli bacterium]
MSKSKVIYLDNAANTLVNPEVLQAYQKVIEQFIANPSSIHFEGQKASHLLSAARQQILDCFQLTDHEVIFTSGATEANNLAIKGIAFQYANRGHHLITSVAEHPSVLEAFRQLESKFGFSVTYLPINQNGTVNINDLKNAITNETTLVSLMAVNNETGTINPIHDIALLLKQYPKIFFHIDAVQAVGKTVLNYSEIDLVTLAGHKINGLNSCGALLKRKKIELLPLLSGGGQENGMRSGSNDVAMAVSLSKAVRLALLDVPGKIEHILPLNQQIRAYLANNSDLYEINSPQDASPFIVNFSLRNRKASVVVEALSNRGIMISSTSACHARKEPYSYVVEAMGKSEQMFSNTLRVSLDSINTDEEIAAFLAALDEAVKGIKR